MFEMLTAMAEHGDIVVVWILMALSVIGLGLFIERMVVYQKEGAQLPSLKRRLLESSQSEQGLADLERELTEEPSTPARLCAVALQSRARSPEATQEVVDAFAIEERQRLERGVSFLGTVGANAPFIGLFGTVLGIVKAFHDLSIAKSAGPQVVMAGISKALIATAVGLMVAIPAVVAYNYFKGRVKKILASSDILVKLTLSYQIDRYLADPSTGCATREVLGIDGLGAEGKGNTDSDEASGEKSSVKTSSEPEATTA